MERFAVIGLGRFGKRLAMLLADAGAEVIAVDTDRAVVESVKDEVSLAVCLDSTDREAIHKALESGIEYKGLVRHYNPAFTGDNHDALTPKQAFMARYRKDGVIVPIK